MNFTFFKTKQEKLKSTNSYRVANFQVMQPSSSVPADSVISVKLQLDNTAIVCEMQETSYESNFSSRTLGGAGGN